MSKQAFTLVTMHNYYELLGVARTATQDEVVAACLRLGEKYRPDRNAHDTLAAETFALVESAFAVLSEPEKRAAYDVELAASEQPTAEAMAAVKILDAGPKRLISGMEMAAVEAALKDHLGRGSKLVTPLTKVGSKWLAACTVPVRARPAEQTTTLKLAGLQAQIDPYADEDDGECRIEKLGFKRIVRGPTKVAVEAKVEEIVELGAILLGQIELEDDGQWVAICDTGGQQNTGFRW